MAKQAEVNEMLKDMKNEGRPEEERRPSFLCGIQDVLSPTFTILTGTFRQARASALAMYNPSWHAVIKMDSTRPFAASSVPSCRAVSTLSQVSQVSQYYFVAGQRKLG